MRNCENNNQKRDFGKMLIKVITKMNVYEVKQVVSTCMNKCFTLSLFYLLKVLDLLNSTSQKKSLIPKQRM